ncbi:MAG: class I tRNA ligase family protein, partial [Candidatus Methanomethylophilaceae archaeon]|nr:class I tRNA ligase family protein [Candidatus Methanomethylophilaceae archaeon]
LIRYYLSAIMPDTHDSEFSWDDFITKINNELVADLGNYYHRCLSFTKKNFGTVPEAGGDPEAGKAIEDAFKEYSECVGRCDFKKGLKVMMDLAHFGNRYFDSKKPWALVKDDKEACGRVMGDNLRIVKALCMMAWPYMPRSSEKVWSYLGYCGTPEDMGFDKIMEPVPAGQALQEPIPVYRKIEVKKEEKPKEQKKEAPAAVLDGPFADFRRMDIRVGEVISVDDHPEAEKLYVLKIDLGEEEPRQIVTNLKSVYSREQMLGRKLLVISNLKPAKFRGVQSSGMLMAADDEPLGGSAILLLKPSKDVPNGTAVNCGMQCSSSRIEVKHCEKATIKVARVKDGKFLGKDIELPEGSPEVVVAVIDGDKAVPLGDGKGCVMTVESEVMDGADVV